MRYLLFISCIFVLSGCASLYSNLKKTVADVDCVKKFKPDFVSALYKANVDVVGKHLSGLLIIKQMPDSSMRIVFSSEVGFTFFDFKFSKDGEFKVHQIFKQMDKKPVIKTLRKDFELVLMQNIDSKTFYSLKDSNVVYTAFKQKKDFYYYITDASCTRLIKMERASKRKVVMETIAHDYVNGMPDTIGISHKNFHFDIGLKRIER